MGKRHSLTQKEIDEAYRTVFDDVLPGATWKKGRLTPWMAKFKNGLTIVVDKLSPQATEGMILATLTVKASRSSKIVIAMKRITMRQTQQGLELYLEAAMLAVMDKIEDTLDGWQRDLDGARP